MIDRSLLQVVAGSLSLPQFELAPTIILGQTISRNIRSISQESWSLQVPHTLSLNKLKPLGTISIINQTFVCEYYGSRLMDDG